MNAVIIEVTYICQQCGQRLKGSVRVDYAVGGIVPDNLPDGWYIRMEAPRNEFVKGVTQVICAACVSKGVQPFQERPRLVRPLADEQAVRLREAAPDLLAAIQGLGAKPEGYCFCHDAAQVAAGHTGECREACAAIEKATKP